jgi:hypothetical protein
LSFAVTKDAWSGAAGVLFALPHGGTLRRIERATGAMKLGGAPELALGIEPIAGEAPENLARDFEALVAQLRAVRLVLPDVMGEKEALAAAKVAAEGGAVVVRAPWPIAGLDRACERLAQGIRGLR